MKKMISLILILIMIYSCNENEKLNLYNLRLDNILILSQSSKNENNEYLKTLIDSIKIIQNEYKNLKNNDKNKLELDFKKNKIDSLVNFKISQNCILNRTYELIINNEGYINDKGMTEVSQLKFEVTFLKNNKCEIKTYIYFLMSQFFNTNWEESTKYLFSDEKIENLTLRKMIRQNNYYTNYEQINEDLFKVVNDDFPIPMFLKVIDKNDCECSLSNSNI